MIQYKSLFLAALLASVGCGKGEKATSKPTLNETEKQQVIDLKKQRESEWKTTPKNEPNR